VLLLFDVLHPHPLAPSAFFSSSNLQQASVLLAGAPPQQPVAAVFSFAGKTVLFFSNGKIFWGSILLSFNF
jgi:hypothetical protein